MKKMHHLKEVEREPWAHVPRFMWQLPNVSMLSVKTQKSLFDAHVQSSFEPNNIRNVIEFKENLGLTFIFSTNGQTSHADQKSTKFQDALCTMKSTCLSSLYLKCSFSFGASITLVMKCLFVWVLFTSIPKCQGVPA